MKKQHVFVIVLILLAVAAGAMIERNSPTESDVSSSLPEAISAYPVDDWYTVEPTVVFPYEAYPAPDYSGYPVPYWDDPLPTPAPEYGEYPYP
jgi:hypothetical protein